jgi:hypothetical protein
MNNPAGDKMKFALIGLNVVDLLVTIAVSKSSRKKLQLPRIST